MSGDTVSRLINTQNSDADRDNVVSDRTSYDESENFRRSKEKIAQVIKRQMNKRNSEYVDAGILFAKPE